jgi:hypothetical protein
MASNLKSGITRRDGKMNEDRCVVCGAIIPEGRMICLRCEDIEPNFDKVKTMVVLNEITDIKEFVNLASMCKDDVVIKSGRFAINAKSIMSLFSLDTSKPVEVEFYGDIPYKVREGMKKFIVN